MKPDHRLPSPLPPSSAFRPDLSRASSTSSQASNGYFNQPIVQDRAASLGIPDQNKTTLPGLSQIAGLAATQTPNRSFSASHAPMSYHTPIPPIPTPGIAGSAPPVCQNCQTSTTPLWRRDEQGSVLCNACGLFLKLHGRPRPISLKTDVIKSRNRAKAHQPQKRKLENGLPATQTADMITPQNRRVSHMATSVTSDRSHSPISRTGTPAMHDPNIAPQHLFDGVHLSDQGFGGSPSLPPLNLNQPSPTSIDAAGGYEALVAANTNLRTRVSELEVINMVYSDNENNLRTERDTAVRERDELKRKVEELEQQLKDASDLSHPNKRTKVSATVETPSEDVPADK